MNSAIETCLIVPESDELTLLFAIYFNHNTLITISDHEVLELLFLVDFQIDIQLHQYLRICKFSKYI